MLPLFLSFKTPCLMQGNFWYVKQTCMPVSGQAACGTGSAS